MIGEFKNNFVGYKVGIILIKIVGIEYRSLEIFVDKRERGERESVCVICKMLVYFDCKVLIKNLEINIFCELKYVGKWILCVIICVSV